MAWTTSTFLKMFQACRLIDPSDEALRLGPLFADATAKLAEIAWRSSSFRAAV